MAITHVKSTRFKKLVSHSGLNLVLRDIGVLVEILNCSGHCISPSGLPPLELETLSVTIHNTDTPLI